MHTPTQPEKETNNSQTSKHAIPRTIWHYKEAECTKQGDRTHTNNFRTSFKETGASRLALMFSWRHSPALRPEGSSWVWQWRRGSCRTLCRSCQRGHCRRSVGRCMRHPHRPGHPQHLALASPWRSREWRLRPAVSVGLRKGLQCSSSE